MSTFLDLTADNLDDHHLCCALGDKKHVAGVEAKRAWLRARFAEGLVFRKLDVRGKVFIEYAPAETAWRPVVAPGWLVIHCLWVSGRFAKQGHAKALLHSCIDDARARGKKGVVVASAKTKRPFLSDRKFFLRHGFEVVDTAGEFVLLGLRTSEGGETPRFASAVRRAQSASVGEGSFVARFTDQCPFNRHWAEVVKNDLREAGHEAETEHITDLATAQEVASPLGTYGLERGDGLASHFLTSTKATERMLAKLEV